MIYMVYVCWYLIKIEFLWIFILNILFYIYFLMLKFYFNILLWYVLWLAIVLSIRAYIVISLKNYIRIFLYINFFYKVLYLGIYKLCFEILNMLYKISGGFIVKSIVFRFFLNINYFLVYIYIYLFLLYGK